MTPDAEPLEGARQVDAWGRVTTFRSARFAKLAERMEGYMISLDDAVVFVTLVTAQNLSAAGRRLNMSTSTVSKRISRLEHALKAQLVIRSSRRITLTEAGSVFFEQCAGLLPIMETATQMVQEFHNEPRGRIRIHTTAGIATKLVAPLISEFRRIHQNVEFEIITRSRNNAPLEEGNDVIIGSVDLQHKSLQSADLGAFDYVICASPAYLARSGNLTSPQDLTQHDCLLYLDEETNRPVVDWPFVSNGRHFEVRVHGVVTSNNSAALTELTLKGAGVALLPVFAVFDEIRAGNLVVLLRDDVAYSRQLKAFYPRSEHSPKSVRAFLQFVETHLKHRALKDLWSVQ